MLRFEMDLIAADLAERTIEGVVVPYGEVGRIAGVAYRFAPGSVRAARARTPLLVDHDRGQPIGTLDRLEETSSGLLGRFRVDATPAGDTALVQAASGSRGSLSLGAELVASNEADDGIVEVSEALLLEASLLALGAFPSATVTRVAAEADPPEEEQEELELDDDDEDEDEDEAGAAGDNDPEEGQAMTAASAAPPVIRAGADRPRRELTAGEFAHHLVRAQRGDREALTVLEAALTETISTDLSGVLPPTYERSVIGPPPPPRILYEVFRGRALPGVGLTVQKPSWTTLPVGAWAATVDADATTSKAVIGLNAATIERWDWATAISYVAAERSSPDAIDTMYSAAVDQFHKAVEGKIAALLTATAGTANAAVKLGAGIGAFYVAAGTAPEVIIVAPDVWGTLADAGALNVPYGFASGGSPSASDGLRSSYAGIPIVSSGLLAPTQKFLVTRRALDVRVTEPVRLTANAIGALNVELGVVGEALFDADVPLEVMLLTAGTPVGLLAEDSGSSRSK